MIFRRFCFRGHKARRSLHFQPKCLSITQDSLPPLEPLEKAFAIAALTCKPPPSTNPNPFAAKIQNAYTSHVKAQYAPPAAPEQLLTKTDADPQDGPLTPLEDQKFPEHILKEYEEYLAKQVSKKQWARESRPKLQTNLPGEFGFVATELNVPIEKRMGARHLYNVLIEHPDLLCLRSDKTISAVLDDEGPEERYVFHAFTSQAVLNKFLAAHKMAPDSFCRMSGAKLVAMACSGDADPSPDGIRLHTSLGSGYLTSLELEHALETRQLRDLLSLVKKRQPLPDKSLEQTRDFFMQQVFYCVPHVELGSEKRPVVLSVDEKPQLPLFGDPVSAEFFTKGLELQFDPGQLRYAPQVVAVYPEEFPDMLEKMAGILFEPMWEEVPGEPVPVLLEKAQLAWLFES